MKKLTKLSLDKIKVNILNENELKQIFGGSGDSDIGGNARNINCIISDSEGILSMGPCAMSSATECQSQCMNTYADYGFGCDCH